MDTLKYRSKSIYVEHINKANKLGMTMNEYITHLADLAAKEKTTEQAHQDERLKTVESTISSMAEALKHIRYMQDSQSRKIDQLTEALTKITDAYGADVEFVQALKKEITQ